MNVMQFFSPMKCALFSPRGELSTNINFPHMCARVANRAGPHKYGGDGIEEDEHCSFFSRTRPYVGRRDNTLQQLLVIEAIIGMSIFFTESPLRNQ